MPLLVDPRTHVGFVLDVGAGEDVLAREKTLVRMYMVELMLRGLTTIRTSILTHGNEYTDNIVVHEGVEGYAGVVDVCPVRRPDADVLAALDGIQPAPVGTASDAVDALIAAITTMLSKSRGEPSAAWTRVIYLFVRLGVAVDASDLDAISDRLVHARIELRIVVLDTPDPKLCAPWSELHPGLFVDLDAAEKDACAPAIQQAHSAPAHTALTFGDGGADQLYIPVCVLKATAMQRALGPTRTTADGTPVNVRYQYFRARELAEDEGAHPLPPECESTFQRAFRLGASLVPVHDVSSAPLDTHAGLEILHFVHAATFRREYVLGETSHVVPDERMACADVQLASLARACAALGRLALCRYVVRERSAPRLCVLAPMDPPTGFVLANVPFRSDVQRATFPPLDRVTTRDGAEERAHFSIPTHTQQAAMDAFVDALDARGAPPPEACANPGIHGIKRMLKLRVAGMRGEYKAAFGAGDSDAARAARSTCFAAHGGRSAKRARDAEGHPLPKPPPPPPAA